MSGTLKIGQLATRTGATPKTIRYYELLGLLPEPDRTDSGYRLYDEKDVERLTFIKKAKGLGFSLTDIRETLTLYDSQQAPCVHVVALLDRKIQEIDRLVNELEELQQELVRLSGESAKRLQNLPQGTAICGIIERGVHHKGELALAWLEGRKLGKQSRESSQRNP